MISNTFCFRNLVWDPPSPFFGFYNAFRPFFAFLVFNLSGLKSDFFDKITKQKLLEMKLWEAQTLKLFLLQTLTIREKIMKEVRSDPLLHWIGWKVARVEYGINVNDTWYCVRNKDTIKWIHILKLWIVV